MPTNKTTILVFQIGAHLREDAERRVRSNTFALGPFGYRFRLELVYHKGSLGLYCGARPTHEQPHEQEH